MNKKIDFAVGGQAVIEGVMMRSPSFIAIAVQKKNGAIKIKERPFKPVVERIKWLKIPIIRGMINLVEMMVVGMHALNFSAQEYAEDMDEEKENEQKKENRWLSGAVFALSFIASLGLAVFLFKFIPLAITEWLRSRFPYIADHYVVFNLIDGAIRLAIFLAYIAVLSLWKDFRRIFEYHGAEHKSIRAYEKGLELTPENAKKQPRFHPRCGTSFIVIVLLISIVVYTFVPRNPVFWQNLLTRIAVLPLIAGIGYELLKLSSRRMEHALVRGLVAPGLWSQRLTTKEPDEKQLAVALKALEATLKLETKTKPLKIPAMQEDKPFPMEPY